MSTHIRSSKLHCRHNSLLCANLQEEFNCLSLHRILCSLVALPGSEQSLQRPGALLQHLSWATLHLKSWQVKATRLVLKAKTAEVPHMAFCPTSTAQGSQPTGNQLQSPAPHSCARTACVQLVWKQHGSKSMLHLHQEPGKLCKIPHPMLLYPGKRNNCILYPEGN